METQKLKSFLMWCTILNGGVLALAILGCILASDPGYTLQSHWFAVPRESVSIVTYGFLGVFKIFWLVFNVVPYVALHIITRRQHDERGLANPWQGQMGAPKAS